MTQPSRYDPASRRGALEGSFREVVPQVPDLHGRLVAPVALVPRDPEGKPWDLMRGEQPTWFARFDLYRSLGPSRSLAEAYRTYLHQEAQRREAPLPKTLSRRRSTSAPTNWWKTAHQWRWKERAEAHDTHRVEVARVAEFKAIADARSAQVMAGRVTRSTALKAIQLYNQNPSMIKPGEAALLLKIGDDLISKGLGLDDAANAHPGEPMHVKVIDLGDDDGDQPALPAPSS